MKRWWAVLLLGFFVLSTPAVPAVAQVSGETGKYYVVAAPVNGQREYLYSIALRTLGSGNRFHEIIQLNRGRKQPDGATFTDGVELAPGWIIMLPSDASGPGVRAGPLPAIGPPAVQPTPGTTTQRASPSASPTRPAADVATGPTANTERPGLSRYGPIAIRLGAGLLTVALSAGALVVVRRGAYSLRPVVLDDGPWPPHRHHTPTPAELEALAAPPPAPEQLMADQLVVEHDYGLAEQFDAEEWLVDTPDQARPALPADDDLPYLRTDLLSEVGPIMVRLAGATTGPATPAYAWLAETDPPPAAAVPLVLGRQGPWRLHVDLGRMPDVFTLVGDLADCRQLAASYARQLRADGIRVAVVGDAIGAETFDGFPAPGDEPPEPYVVITAGLPEDPMAGIRELATRGRCIPVVIGQVPHSRWSAESGYEPASGEFRQEFVTAP